MPMTEPGSTRPPQSLQSAAPTAPAAAPSTDARERVVSTLSHHFAADRIPMEEFERRVELAYAARSMPELAAIVADLPAIVIESNETSAARAAAPASAATKLVAVFSNQERRGAMLVPRRLKVVSVFANVELDLSDATFESGLTEIEVNSVFGNVEITVPDGVRVELTGHAVLGSFSAGGVGGFGVPSTSGASDIVVRISGHAVLANVETHASNARALLPGQDAARRG
jgi:hypothetical protein